MHDHNLDDLIIDDIEPKNSKTKSFLTIVALLIVVLIVAIILTKILLKTPNNNDLAFEQDTTELIAPELKLKETPEPLKTKQEPVLSSIVESGAKTPTDKVKKEVTVKEPAVAVKKEKTKPEAKLPETPKVVEKEPVLSNITEQEIKAPVVKTKKSVTIKEPVVAIKEEAVKETVTAKKPIVIIKEEKAEEIVKETMQTIEPVKPKKIEVPVIRTPEPRVQPVKKVVVPKPVKKPVVVSPAPRAVSAKIYYIQVGSFKKQPSSRFISVIKNNGFKHKITKSTADGTKKLLIGPYDDRASVNRALVQVRDRINKSAFVIKR